MRKPKRMKTPMQKLMPIRRVRRVASRQRVLTETPLSPRHRQYLEQPLKPFKERPLGGYGSTAFESFEYDPKTKSVKATFWKNYKTKTLGGTYIFWDIAEWEYEEFLRSSSKGRYFYYHWRYPSGDRYKAYTKV